MAAIDSVVAVLGHIRERQLQKIPDILITRLELRS